MNKITKKKWINTLRSGKYTQGRLRLKDHVGNYCCLGVLCDLVGNTSSFTTGNSFPITTSDNGPLEYLGLKPSTQRKLAKMNDNDRLTFEEIANWIERHVKED